eukprot:352338-Chlamydomonas_euryale.AAC.2
MHVPPTRAWYAAAPAPTEAAPFPAERDDARRRRFCRAVWQLHSNLMSGYHLWRATVGLPHARLASADAVLERETWDAPAAIHGLLTELAAYLLVRCSCEKLRAQLLRRADQGRVCCIPHSVSQGPLDCCAGQTKGGPVPQLARRPVVPPVRRQADTARRPL